MTYYTNKSIILLTFYLIKFLFDSSYWIVYKTGSGLYYLIKKKENGKLNEQKNIQLKLLKEEIKSEIKNELIKNKN